MKKQLATRISPEAIQALSEKAQRHNLPQSVIVERAIMEWSPDTPEAAINTALHARLADLFNALGVEHMDPETTEEEFTAFLRTVRDAIHGRVSEASVNATQNDLNALEGAITPSAKENAMAGEIERLRAENARLVQQLSAQWEE